MCVIACSLCPWLLVPKCIVCIVLNAYNFFGLSFIIHMCYNYIHNHEFSIALSHCFLCIIKCIFFCKILNIECIVLILNLLVHCSSSLSLLFMFIIYKPCQLPLSLPMDFKHNFLFWIKSLLFIHLMLVPTKALSLVSIV